jgi:hypothetical protein
MFMNFIRLLLFFATIAVKISAAEDCPFEEFEDYGIKRYRMGNQIYSSPVTVEHHLQNIDKGCYLYYLFKNAWEVKVLQSAPSPDPQKISEIVHTGLSGNEEYKDLRENIINYIEPDRLPKQLAFKLGMIMVLHGNFLKESADCNSEPDPFAKRLELYKNSLLLFSYSLDFSESAPAILQHEDLDSLASHPEFSSEVDSCFRKAFATVEEAVWIEKLLKVEQNSSCHDSQPHSISLYEVCGLLRSIYHFFLNNRDSLPPLYETIAAHLCNITTKVIVAMQKNPNYHIDSANVRLFQAYLDLRKWKSICDPMLFPLVETRCVNLMPQSFTLEDMTEKNEYAICETVWKRNFTPTNQGDWKKEEEIFEEISYTEVEIQGYFWDLHTFFHEMVEFGRGNTTWIYENLTPDWTFQIYNYVSGYIDVHDLPITHENALEYLFRIKVFDIRITLWNSSHSDRFYFPRSTYELRKHIFKMYPHLTSREVFTNWIDLDELRSEHKKELAKDLEKFRIGNTNYLSPTTVEDHLQRVDELCYLYWLFHYAWEVEALQRAPTTDETQQKISEIVHTHLSGNDDYKDLRENIMDYVEPDRLPKQLAFKFGMLMALHGNFLKELSNADPFAKRLELYKNCLLLFSYSLGFSESAPAILQHEDLDALASDPEFSSEVDSCFQKAFTAVDEVAWIEKLLKVQQNSKSYHTDHLTISLYQVCGLLRSIYTFFLNHSDSLPVSYQAIAAHLCNITTKVVLQTQKNPNCHLDGANVRLFQAYIDLKKWGPLCDPTLLPPVETQCVKLMPQLDVGINEENEFAICEAVRMRNLIPATREDWKKGEEIINEFLFSQGEMQHLLLDLYRFFNQMARFGRGYETYIDDLIQDWSFQIYNYVSGYIEIGDLPITQENALEYLFRIKVFDMATALWNSHFHPVKLPGGSLPRGHSPFDRFHFPKSTYELRKHILKICPYLRSYEVFTNSIHPDKLRHEKEGALTPDSWISESELIRQACVDELLQKALKLSEMMEQSPLQGIIVGTRGISGAGKSTFLKKNIFPLLPSEDLMDGVLNPDILKASLKKLQGDTLNIQVHEEAANAFKQIFTEIAEKGSYILDKRHLTPYDIAANLVEPAKKGDRSVWLFDFDIPISTCFYRILARPLHGVEPCPEYEALIDGYLSLRRHRKQVVDFVVEENTVAKYELYDQQRLIAHKTDQGLCILDPDLFSESMREPDFSEIEGELSEIIDDISIAKAIANGVIAPEQWELVEQWKGMTLQKALKLHVQGGKDIFDETLFEPPVFYPFDGASWLSDRPCLCDFAQNEHLLHTHGVDETGRGLHWEPTETGLNPRYAPEGHFQMKLGYFIVPRENVDLQSSLRYSDTDKDLGVEFSKWFYRYALQVRFFVHPEAYAHFAPLLSAGIPFIPPSESEYMGTPTSSDNTWLVRNLSNDNDPFLLKMGTPNGSGDIKHLLASDDVIKCLDHQQKLHKLPNNPDLSLFNMSSGIILQNIPGYPGGTIDSGIIFCELPKHLLNEEGKMISFDSLVSCERLPLIYGLMETAIQKGLVNTPMEFLQKYFIEAYLKAIEPLVFKEGYALTGGHLYLTLNADNTIKGFAYRDLQEIALKKNFLESYSWSYRYAHFIKLLNVLTRSESDTLPPHAGAPIRVGTEKPSPERSLYHYLCAKTNDEVVQRLSISPEEAASLLEKLDNAYIALLDKYFSIDGILNSDGTIPCAEKGSLAEKRLHRLNQDLWNSRK